MNQPFQFLADSTVGVPVIVIVSRRCRSVKAREFVAPAAPKSHPGRQFDFEKRSSASSPMVVKNRLPVVVMKTGAPFETRLGLISKQVIEISRNPLRSPVQVFELFGCGNEVLMIVAGGDDDLIEIPIHREAGKIVEAVEPPDVGEVIKPWLTGRFLIERQRLLVGSFLMKFEAKI